MENSSEMLENYIPAATVTATTPLPPIMLMNVLAILHMNTTEQLEQA